MPRLNLDFPYDTMGTPELIAAAVAPFGLTVESFIQRGPAGGNPNADIVGTREGIVLFLGGYSADPEWDATRIE